MSIEHVGKYWIVHKDGVNFHFKTREQARIFRRETKTLHGIHQYSECMKSMAEIIPQKFLCGQVVRCNNAFHRFVAPIAETKMTPQGWGYKLKNFSVFHGEESLTLIKRTKDFTEFYNKKEFVFLLDCTRNLFRSVNTRAHYSILHIVEISAYLQGLVNAAKAWGVAFKYVVDFIDTGLLTAAESEAKRLLKNKYVIKPCTLSPFAHVTMVHDVIREKTGVCVLDDYGLKLFRDEHAYYLYTNEHGQALEELGGSI